MSGFRYNLLLAFVWAFSLGELSLSQLLVGYVLGFGVLFATQDLIGSRGYCKRVPLVLRFLCYFVYAVLVANLRVAYDVMTPTHYMRPGILAVPLDAKTDQEITWLANLISLTPGTLSLDVSPDRRFLYVHSMYIEHPELEKQNLKNGFEKRLLELLR